MRSRFDVEKPAPRAAGTSAWAMQSLSEIAGCPCKTSVRVEKGSLTAFMDEILLLWIRSELLHRPFQFFVDDMRIDHRCREVGVTEGLLNHSNVTGLPVEPYGEGVPKRIRTDATYLSVPAGRVCTCSGRRKRQAARAPLRQRQRSAHYLFWRFPASHPPARNFSSTRWLHLQVRRRPEATTRPEGRRPRPKPRSRPVSLPHRPLAGTATGWPSTFFSARPCRTY